MLRFHLVGVGISPGTSTLGFRLGGVDAAEKKKKKERGIGVAQTKSTVSSRAFGDS